MEQSGGQIILNAAAPQIGERLSGLRSAEGAYSRHFTQSEEFFLELAKHYEVAPIAIHHDVNRSQPAAGFLDAVSLVLDQIIPEIAEVLCDLQFGFNPLHPASALFYRVLQHNQQRFLYLVTLDLSYRPLLHQVIEQGSNDVAPRYRTNRVFCAVDLIPLREGLLVEQSISQTWIGETGRGYITQGIWIDQDLNKFLTKLFLAPGQRIYPYYPFHTKFKAICFSPLDVSAALRERSVELLCAARAFLLPRIDDILETLKARPFSEELPLFLQLRRQLDAGWHSVWSGIRLRPYLNEQDMKEYIVERQ